MSTADFLANIAPDSLILTANQRLATYYQQTYATVQTKKNLTAWPSLKCLAFTHWLENCWQQISRFSKLTPLSEHEETLLWQQCLTEHETNQTLSHRGNLAKLSQQAWQLCQLWQIDPLSLSAYGHEEFHQFQSTLRNFQAQCRRHQRCDHTAVLAAVVKHLKTLNLPKQILLAGFDQFNPLQQVLLAKLRELGVDVAVLETSKMTPHARAYAFSDKYNEMWAMANWAKQAFDEHKQVACVVPDLHQSHTALARIFALTFAEEIALTAMPHTPYNFSVGHSLAQTPLIHSALRLLELLSPPFADELIDFTLRTPFASFDKGALSTIKLNHSRAARPSQWRETFRQHLASLTWPGKQGCHGVEYQQLMRWQSVLDEFASLDELTGPIDFKSAHQLLTEHCQQTIFQAENRQASIQILGVLESAGMQFDAVWIMGMHDQAWPPPGQANPLLPHSLQREWQMPYADQARELAIATTITQRLLQMAPDVTVSYAHTEADQLFKISPLFNHIIPHDTPPEQRYQLAYQLQQTQQLESLIDQIAPSLPQQHLKGGSGILQKQALCPFRAFAEIRLDASRLEPAKIGLDPLTKGNLLHSCLEWIWQQLADQQQLLALDENALNQLVEEAIQQSFKQLPIKQRKLTLTQIESQRLQKILINWLVIEKQRPPFKVVATEQTQSLTLGKLSLRLRVDRIDQLADHSYCIIDYKTGTPSLSSWFSERPDEPQLPLYALSQTQTSVIAFAQLRADKQKFIGLAACEQNITGISTYDKSRYAEYQDWHSQLNAWQNDLNQLADDFLSGDAAVNPKSTMACANCHLQSLCRIHQQELET